ncbi:30S ribosomal protein S17 [Wolbachia endosymbiont of Howardula sp.]|uniref:30S ribosomal protein S17 n=1 Tax=Wolbachia endosymbiont of Howardula sp. TaxID=2916816 RepID=UPI00217D4A2B|nr:30S ribosomal protein S17 [Wolbachia endosymbiont of Howardula sp.]UWI83162.1 30S ribosomal protein S17 [Wolbachia endosymbiont of Howardula sp.]
MSKRIFCGTVVSSKCDKTVKVSVLRVHRHGVYKKVIKQYKKYTAHDEKNIYTVGDRVIIQECKPIANTKKWSVLNYVAH